MKSQLAVLLGALVLAAVPAAAAWDDDVVSLNLPSGELEVMVVPEGGRSLTFTPSAGDQYWYQGPTSALVGRPYSIFLRNRTDERLKVVVAVDGVNVYWKAPLRGVADGDVGSILGPGERREITGFQVDRSTAQRFVFSPPEWSEGGARGTSPIGTMDVQVYREYHAWTDMPAGSADAEKRGEAPSMQRAPAPSAQPPIGTTAGEDIESNVRRVQFVAATRVPEGRAILVYGHPERVGGGEVGGRRLGIRAADEQQGIRIHEVFPGTTAAEVGLLPGDLILKVDSMVAPSVRDLQRTLEHKRHGDYLFLEVGRGRHQLSFKVRLD